MILNNNQTITLAEALELVRAQYGAAPGKLVLSSERPTSRLCVPDVVVAGVLGTAYTRTAPSAASTIVSQSADVIGPVLDSTV